MVNKSLFCLAFAAFFSIISCKVQPFDEVITSSNSDWAVPLIDSKKSFNDIINGFDKQAILEILPDNTLNLHYKGEFLSRSSLDIFKNFQNQPIPILDSVVNVPMSAPGGVTIDYADLKSGALYFSYGTLPPFSPPLTELLNITIDIPQLTKNGVPFQKKFTAIGTYSDSLNVKGWRLTSNSNNEIVIRTDVRRANGTRIQQNALFTIRNFQFSLVKGYLGMQVFDAPSDTIEIDFFRKWQNGNVRFENPKMSISLDNSFGMPVRSIVRTAEVVSLDGSVVKMQSSFITNGIDINYPSFAEIGKSKRTVVVFDKTNSNLASIVSANPVAINYKIDGLTNADPNQKAIGFLTDSSAFKLQVELDLPIYGTAKSFDVFDSLSLDFTKYTNVSQAEFKVTTDNGMPVDMALQGYFVNANGAVIDSFYQNSTFVLRGAPVGADGLPTSITSTESILKIDGDKLKKVMAATKLRTKLSVSTTNNGSIPVKLTSKQDVRVRIGVRFGAKL